MRSTLWASAGFVHTQGQGEMVLDGAAAYGDLEIASRDSSINTRQLSAGKMEFHGAAAVRMGIVRASVHGQNGKGHSGCSSKGGASNMPQELGAPGKEKKGLDR
jgi:hypothetical protein